MTLYKTVGIKKGSPKLLGLLQKEEGRREEGVGERGEGRGKRRRRRRSWLLYFII